jgi:filamentous hemagglutinin family protein
MAQSWKVTHRWIERVFWLSVTGATVPLLIESVVRGGDRAFAQIVPDNTLGVEQSIVTPSHTVRGLPGVLIEGGARRGTSLFQSFSDFNVGSGQRVYFASPAGVENILSRVTGRNPSSISGTLGVDGTANLFLLNPRGILFGPNARLDVAGSFIASTADRLDFGNGLSFSATNPEAPPPLTVSLRPGLQYGTNYQGEISSAGHLAVGAGQTLTLAGQSVTVTGSLSTPGGTVQVLGDRIALSDHARINVSGSKGGNVFIGGSFQGNGPLPNAQQTTIGPNVLIQADGIGTGLDPSSFQHGGNVIVWADGITRFYGTITARGGTAGDGGFVEVSGRENLVFNGWVDASAPNGRPGTLLLDPTNIEIVASGGDPGSLDDLLAIPGSNDPKGIGTSVTRINADLINQSPNPVALQASNNITFNAPIVMGNSGISLSAQAGNSIFVNRNISTDQGNVTLNALSGNVEINNATIDTNRLFIGLSGDINIAAGQQIAINNGILDARSNNDGSGFSTIRLTSREGSVSLNQSTASTTNFGTGLAGDIFIDAQERVEITNSSSIFSRGSFGRILIGVNAESELNNLQTTPLPATIRISNSTLNSENSGDTNQGRVSLFARNQVEITNSQLTSRSDNSDTDNFSRIEIVAREGSIALDDNSLISTTNFGTGFSGDVIISARGELSITNSSIFSRGNQGRVLLGQSDNFNANYPDFSPASINIQQRSTVNTNNDSVEGGAGSDIDAGGVSVRSAGLINITGSSEIASSTRRQGDAGAVIVRALDSIALNDSRIFSNVENGGIGDAGIVSMSARSLFVLNGGQIQTLVRGPSDNRPAGEGDAGGVVIFAPETVRVIGRNAEGFPSAIFTSIQSGVNGDGGDVLISTRSLHIRNGAKVDANNFGSGEAGNIFISALGIWVDNRSFITASSLDGQGGNIFLNVPGAIILGRNSNITTSTLQGSTAFGERAGNIAIGSGNPQEEFTSSTGIAYRFDDRILLLAGKTARDNNIYSVGIRADGGFIRVNAFRLQDIARRLDAPSTNDITAESIFGVSGDVVVSAVNIFPSFRVDPLPERYEAPRVSEGCDPRIRQETSQFVVTGRGGLPADPTEVLSPDTIATSGDQSPTMVAPTGTVSTESPSINPARGWVRDANGNVRLVAHTPDPTDLSIPSFLWSIPGACNTH